MQNTARSYLFVPGDRPERFDKAAASGAHRLILDLEDAVAPTSKEVGRIAVARWLTQHSDVGVLVRINAIDSPWYEGDMAMLLNSRGVGLMLPKADPDTAAKAIQKLGNCSSREVVMLVETVRGLLGLRSIASLAGVTRIAFGNIDFSVDSGMADDYDEPGMTAARVQIALESRMAELLPPIDGVTTAIDADTAGRQALRARRLGFGAKLCIHPRQVNGVNGSFAPTVEELEWATRVLAAFEASRGAAVALDGKMIDRPVVDRAHRLIASSI
jgi:citrate lyase subunit beta/citryl-CoA lyase